MDDRDHDVIISLPDERSTIRHPSDLLRLVIALVVVLFGFLLATMLNEISSAVTIEVVEAFDRLPDPVVIVAILVVAFFSLLLPFFAIGYLMKQRLWRRLFVALLAAALAIGLIALIDSFLVSRFAGPAINFDPPSWLCAPDAGPQPGLTCVAGSQDDLFSVVWLTGLVAFFSTLAPWMNRRWRRFAWLTFVVLTVFQFLGSTEPETKIFLAVGIAYAVGAGVVLALGDPDRRPTGAAIVAALSRSGFVLSELHPAAVDARGSVPYLATDRDGNGLFIKVLSPEERAADVLFRIVRMFRLKGVGDERPFSSLKRGVEHEALVALKAQADGVHTPQLQAVAEIPPNSVLLAYEAIDGQSLDSTPAEQLTDDLLRGVWGQVAILRERRTAHRDLRLANVFVDSAGEPWLIDFGFSELAATDGQLRSDVAELVMSTAPVIGAERAVRLAVDGIGADAVAEAAARIQPLALSGATRSALKQHPGLDDEVRTEIERQTGDDGVELEDLERVKPRIVIMILGFGLALYFLIPQLTQTDFGAVLDAKWQWAPLILAASAITYVGAAYNLMGAVPEPVRLVPTFLTQLAGSFINRITPVKVGAMATNVRFLQKNGVELSVAIAGLGVSQVSTIAVHMSLLAATVVFLGRNIGDFISLPSGNVVLIGAVAVFTLAGLVVFLPFGRKIVKEKVWPAIAESGQGLVRVASNPSKAVMLFGGALLMITTYIAALWFSLQAFGGGLGIAGVALVFLGGQALGNLAPTPGGIGATEAAMIAAMTALGLDAAVAVPTVFLYRIGTFWLPILPGLWSLRKLEADGLL